jgi:hypothetical protein
VETDTLNSLVTGAIWRAEQLEAHGIGSASQAWAEVSSLEEELAKVLPMSEPEGRVARRGAVVEALKAVPRLANQKPIRVVPVLSRTTAEPPKQERFAKGVKRLLELGEAKAHGKNDPALFALPHDGVLGASERVVGGERNASAFSPLYKAYLELFQTLFPSRAEPARQVLERLEAIAEIREELTHRRDSHEFDDLLSPWSDSAIHEGFLWKADSGGGSRYADLACRGETDPLLIVVEYIGDGSENEALVFWGKSTKARCVVLLLPRRQVFTRDREGKLRRVDRWDLPRPREFELLRDVGDRSVESMLDAVRHGHVEAVAWLVNEWRDCSISGNEMRGMPGRGHWRPERAQRILDGLAATEDPRCAEEILRRATPGGSDLRHRKRDFRDDWDFGEDLVQKVAEDLFAPLFWRLPVEAVLKSMEARRYPGERGSLAGYRLLAHELMGLRYDPTAALSRKRVSCPHGYRSPATTGTKVRTNEPSCGCTEADVDKANGCDSPWSRRQLSFGKLCYRKSRTGEARWKRRKGRWGKR